MFVLIQLNAFYMLLSYLMNLKVLLNSSHSGFFSLYYPNIQLFLSLLGKQKALSQSMPSWFKISWAKFNIDAWFHASGGKKQERRSLLCILKNHCFFCFTIALLSPMNPLSLLVLGGLLLAEGGLGEKGAFETILDVNLGNGEL